MVDITQKPYFQHNDTIHHLMKPIRAMADIDLIGYSRDFTNGEQFLICPLKEWGIDFFTISKLYRYGLYNNTRELSSTFDMWDHLPYAPPEIYQANKKKFGLAHGLTIIQQYGEYCDSFVFSTRPGNNQVNNFYLNHKELLIDFMKNFYVHLADTLMDLSRQTFRLPTNTKFASIPSLTLSPRQRDCAQLLIQGMSTKVIAQSLGLSPRTIETHISSLMEKLKAKNRAQLTYAISKLL